jgi:hypothetical protein
MVSVLELYCEKCAPIKYMLYYIANGVWMLQNNNGEGGASERCQTATGEVGSGHPGKHRELTSHKNPPWGLGSLGQYPFTPKLSLIGISGR